MIKNYFKIAWRHLWSNKIYSAINIAGLAIGISACIIILLFVFYERSFDNFHTKNIYRLNEVQKFEGMVSSQKVALSMYPMAPTLLQEFPEIKRYARLYAMEKTPLVDNDKKIFLDRICFTDSTFLQLFDFPLLKGAASSALQKPNSIILTKKSAEKIFGSTDAIGKVLKNYDRDTMTLEVTAVMENIPSNSQIQFDALIPFSTIAKPDWMNQWGGNWLNSYFELAPNTNIAALEKKFPAYLKKHLAEDDRWKNYELFLLPLKKIHGSASDIGLDRFNYQQFNESYTNLFFIIALTVLLIARINFMNLSTARSAERAREVGVRKSIGAFRWQLSLQFIAESILLALIATVLAIILVKLFLPAVNQLSQRPLDFPVFTQPKILLLVLAGTIVLGIISGLYPAIYLSSFKPVKVLKGSVKSDTGKSHLRNILVVSQFASAIFLIIATTFALKQLNFMRNKSTGFDREQVINIPLNQGGEKHYDALKKDLLQNTLIKNVTAAQDILGSHLDQSGVDFHGDGPARSLAATRLIVDHDYLNLYKIQLVAGNNFSSEPSANGKEYIINKAMADELMKDQKSKNINSLIGRQFGFDSTGQIIGIAENFNFNSLHNKIETLFIYNQKEWGYSNMSVKINASKPKEALQLIQSVWEKNCPGLPFEYQFLDEHFEEIYKADSQISTIVGSLATLAIIISCLGLFGLASYSAEKRTKEIGVRKVLGASVAQISTMLSKDFLKYVLIATLIAWPLAWWAIHTWLQNYAYRVNISWQVFALAGLASFAIALFTILFQTLKAAVANPIKNLRTE